MQIRRGSRVTVSAMKLLEPALVVTSLSMLSQLIGFIRTALIAAIFGTSITVDAYYLALLVPTYVTTVTAGLLQAGFVPSYVGMRTSAPDDAVAFRTAIFWALVGISGCMGLGFALYAGVLIPRTASVADAKVVEIAIVAAPILASVLVWNVISDFLGLLLNCHGRFAAPAAAPAANAALSSLALVWGNADIVALTASLLLGAIAQTCIVVADLLANRIGFPARKLRLIWALKRFGGLAGPVIPGILFSATTVWLIHVAAASLGPGDLSIFSYGWRLYGVPTQVFILSLSTILLPNFSRLVAERSYFHLATILFLLAKATLLGSLCVLTVVYLFGSTYIEMLLGRGQFDRGDAETVSEVLLGMLAGLFFFTYGTFLSRLLVAQHRTVTVSCSSLIVLVVVVGTLDLWTSRWGVAGIAYALSAGYLVSAFFMQIVVAREISFVLRPGRSMIYLLQSTFVMLASGAAGMLMERVNKDEYVGAVLGGISIAVVCGVLVWLFGLLPVAKARALKRI